MPAPRTGTSVVDLHGLPEEEVLVTLHADDCRRPWPDSRCRIGRHPRGRCKGAGSRLRGDLTDLVLGVTGEITSLDRLRAVVLREDPAGRLTLLGDIADITRGPRQPLAEAALFQGQPAILVSAKLSEGLQVDAGWQVSGQR